MKEVEKHDWNAAGPSLCEMCTIVRILWTWKRDEDVACWFCIQSTVECFIMVHMVGAFLISFTWIMHSDHKVNDRPGSI
jgi:hypothetical protein